MTTGSMSWCEISNHKPAGTGGYGETIYRMHRAVVGVRIGQSRILTHLGLPNVTNEEIDQALDDETG